MCSLHILPEKVLLALRAEGSWLEQEGSAVLAVGQGTGKAERL